MDDRAIELLHGALAWLGTWAGQLASQFLSLQAPYSLLSLISAFCLLGSIVIVRRARAGKQTSFRQLLRAVLPGAMIVHRSHWLDLKWFAFNSFLFTLMFGMFLVSDQFFRHQTLEVLNAAFGTRPAIEWPALATTVVTTVAIFLALELGYYIDHYCSHRFEFLWSFHKLHHSAEILTPFTNSRVHPVDTVLFANIVAVTTGVTSGVLKYLFGEAGTGFTVLDVNALAFLAHYTLNHLLHTQAWIAFTGWLGCVVTSPAHHQLHHSTDPRHFNRNLGGSLMIFDWLFGTLLVPGRTREALTFGVADEGPVLDTVAKGLLLPFMTSVAAISNAASRSPTVPTVEAVDHRPVHEGVTISANH